MAATGTKTVPTTWPIVYTQRRVRRATASSRGAWVLFLGFGLPAALMALLTSLAAAGIYVDLFRPFWQPWPPDLWKPALGAGVFALTLAYLTYRVGLRSGVRSAAMRVIASSQPPRSARPTPPPPPPDDLSWDL